MTERLALLKSGGEINTLLAAEKFATISRAETESAIEAARMARRLLAGKPLLQLHPSRAWAFPPVQRGESAKPVLQDPSRERDKLNPYSSHGQSRNNKRWKFSPGRANRCAFISTY